jgi:hypothetical protein
MSPNLQNRNAPSKDCTVSGCSGTMTLRRPGGPTAQEGSARATWVCDNDPAHTEAAAPSEDS